MRSAFYASLGEVYLCKIQLSFLVIRAVDTKFHTSARGFSPQNCGAVVCFES